MIEKIARDVSNKLNTTISKDFEDMVGMEAHLQKMQSLSHLDYEDEAMIVGICGPAGIGKTTIARALHSRLSSSFQLTCFMENVRGSYNSGLDEYGLKLRLQEQLLTKILNQNDMRIYHLGALPERLHDRKVLIILDDVDDLQQLEALANETMWFGPGSRIIVTTEDQELLEQHNINNIYRVGFPTKEEVRKIFCRYAFRRSSAPYGFEKLVERVTKLCSKLPLGLRVMGSSLRRKKEEDWECILHRLENSIDRKIEGVLRVGYDNLHEKDQFLFLLIAFFFNYTDDGHVKAMLADSNLDVRLGLKTLTYKSLIQISTKGIIVMHKLLQHVGREAVQRLEPWKRQILIHADEIGDVLKNDSGSRTVTGISFDTSTLSNKVCISARAFKTMDNLQFLSIYKTRLDSNDRVHVPEDMDFPPHLRLLHWEVYPGKCLPRTFCPENLVEIDLRWNKLEKLWEGTQPLINLKKMDLLGSMNLKELPDLSNATNLENLVLRGCSSLVEIPASIGNLHKLESLVMDYCTQLQVFPSHFNLESLERAEMVGCWQLRKIPDISTNITRLTIAETMLEELPRLLWSRLETLSIYGSANKSIVSVQEFTKTSGADIERIPGWIKDLDGLTWLHIIDCPKLASMPELPGSLRGLIVDSCEMLELLLFSFDSPVEFLYFPNCFKLCQEARRVITQQSLQACLPGTGRNIPLEYVHRAIGNSLTIRSSFYRFRICAVLSPKQQMEAADYPKLLCRIRINNGCPTDLSINMLIRSVRAEHLFMFLVDLLDKDGWLEQKDNEISFEINTTSQNIDIIECGVQILTDESNRIRQEKSYETSRPEQVSERRDEFDAPSRSKLFSPMEMNIIFIFFYLFSLFDFDFICFVVLNFLFTL